MTPQDPVARLTIFTGSSTGSDLIYQREAHTLGHRLAQAGIGVVYGGAKVGLMGIIADAALEAGGEVIGVMPQGLKDQEIAHPELSQLHVVADMHQRKKMMAELGDGFVAFPGGMGTLEEFFEAWTWQYLGIHGKPVGLYNVESFWQPLLEMVDRMVAEGFLAPWRRDALILSEDPDTLLEHLQAWELPVTR